MSLHQTHPRLSDFEARALRRMPKFCSEYLMSGTGQETGIARNRAALDTVTLTPRALRGDYRPKLSQKFLGQTYALPFGVAPVGATGLMWPGGEAMLARTAASMGLPYCLSTVATQPPEAIGPIAGTMGWFQLYPLKNLEHRADVIRRAKQAGFHTLVLTIDVPERSRRERQIKAGFSVPPKVGISNVIQAMCCPAWSMGILKHGMPTFPTLTPYFSEMKGAAAYSAMAHELHGRPDWSIIAELKQQWDGPLIVKGILSPADAKRAIGGGADGIWISNHGARQIDAAPATIDVLPAIRSAVGENAKIVFDSGVHSGLDVVRGIASGADFVMAGRAFILGLAAFGEAGGRHVAEIFKHDIENYVVQLGAKNLKELRQARASREG